MRIFLAGAEARADEFERAGIDDLLMAYPYIVKKPHVARPQYFIDSGAFTAHQTGKAIDVDDYIAFLKERPELTTYASLDVIGDAEASRRNFERMKSAGLDPIPTFHIGSDERYLRAYCETEPYIALGGIAAMKIQARRLAAFLGRSMSVIGEYWPKKVHAFGCVRWTFLTRWPFYSTDATSWQNPSRYNQILVFEQGRLRRYTPKQRRMWQHVATRPDADMFSAKQLQEAARHLTRLWAARGITFD